MKREAIESGLPEISQPFSWTVRSKGLIFTTHGPVMPEGRILVGDIAEQTDLSLRNMAAAMEAAGGSLETVQQATVYILDDADMGEVDRIWKEYFDAPWPNRATLVVKGLVAPGMRIEIQAIGTVADEAP